MDVDILIPNRVGDTKEPYVTHRSIALAGAGDLGRGIILQQ